MKFLVLLAGAGVLIVALFAYPLGLDNNPTLGVKRQWLALIGVLLLLSVPASALTRKFKSRLVAWLRTRAVLVRAWAVLRRGWAGLRPVWVDAALLLLVILIVWVGVWVTTTGTFARVDYQSSYYDMLADGFLQGQVSLPLQPPAQLAALANPYERSQRQGIDYLWDASYFNGKYYLYWGPLPALLAVPLKLVSGAPVPDQTLCYLFMAAAFLFQVLIMRRLWQRFFHDISGWTIVAGALLAGLSHPLFFILNRPVIYEAALSGGQCFLMAGIYIIVETTGRPVERPVNIVGLSVAGACLAAAVACRASLALPVSLLTLLLLVYLADRTGAFKAIGAHWSLRVVIEQVRRALSLWAGLLLPLVMGAVALMWYNQVRFNDPYEFGFHYVLTARNQNDNLVLVSAAYVLPNIYTFFLRLPSFQPVFPFILADETHWPAFIRYPENYSGYEPTVGVLAAAPAAWFALAAVGFVIWRWRAIWRASHVMTAIVNEDRQVAWVYLWLLGCLLAAAGQALFFFYSTTRYQQDFMPLLNIVALCGAWAGYRMLAGKPRAQKALLGLFYASVVLAGVVGFLLGFSEPYARTLRLGFANNLGTAAATLLEPFRDVYVLIRRALALFSF